MMPIILAVLALQALVPGATSFSVLVRYDRACAATCSWSNGLP